ncbi:Paladin [Sciurus carolinensis]|uniref:Paladin n=1 Tax=Sciurus carolinensis TaxID=30640 RepID=A0AA41SQE7_SCICA|nr:Paladin [Sciurus carolinensis]
MGWGSGEERAGARAGCAPPLPDSAPAIWALRASRRSTDAPWSRGLAGLGSRGCQQTMGTTASTAQQTVLAGTRFEGLLGGGTMDGQHSLSIHSFQTMSLHNSKAKSIIPNKVAPVVITYNYKEEFQGRYFLVWDVTEKVDQLGTLESRGAPNFQQGRSGLAVFGMGQPSLSGFWRVLQKLQKDGRTQRRCHLLCAGGARAVLECQRGLCVLHKNKRNLHENLQDLGPGSLAERLELAIWKEIHDFAQLSGNAYHVYHSTEELRWEPQAVTLQGKDFAHVTEEPTYRYQCLPQPEQGASSEAQLDAFLRVIRETPSLCSSEMPTGLPPLLFSCQSGVGRTNLGMVLGILVLFHHSEIISQPESIPLQTKPLAIPLQTKPLPMEQFQVIQTFLCTMTQERKVVEEVDRAVATCAELKEVVLESQRQLEGIQSRAQGSGRQHEAGQRALRSLERYFYLVPFNYYLYKQNTLTFALSFSRWLCAHPELYRLPVTLSSAGHPAPRDLLAKGSLEVDDLVSPDALSAIGAMDVANFQLVPHMPIYSMAQPSAKALGSILTYLTDAKRKLWQVVWVNLREEAVLQCYGEGRQGEAGGWEAAVVRHAVPGALHLPDPLQHLYLEKTRSWQRPFSTWMREVASKAGIYEILDQLDFPELEDLERQPALLAAMTPVAGAEPQS